MGVRTANVTAFLCYARTCNLGGYQYACFSALTLLFGVLDLKESISAVQQFSEVML